MNPEFCILLVLALVLAISDRVSFSGTAKALLKMIAEEKEASKAREDEMWRRAEVEKIKLRESLAAAHSDLLKVKIIATRGGPVPTQQTMPFATRPIPQVRQNIAGIHDTATP